MDKKEIVLDTKTGSVKEFEIYDLVKYFDKGLTTQTVPFDFAAPPIHPVYFAQSLFETMFKHKGMGLSANQCGVPYSVFVVGMDQENKQAFFNPYVVETSEETIAVEEGCLSYPNLFLKISRPTWITLKFQQANGQHYTQTFSGLTGRIIQHEMMHLEGKRFTDMVTKSALDRARTKQKKLDRMIKKHGKISER